ncbi:MAG: glucans biosynthesis glucosyltransferase MdoH [Hyphomicrobiales bacterium]
MTADQGEPRAGGAMPPLAPLEMPVQNLRKHVRTAPREGSRGKVFLARLLVFLGTALLTAYGAFEMYGVVHVKSTTYLQWLYIALFAITFGWIALAAVSAIVGMIIVPEAPASEPAEGMPVTRTALVMPVYNEDPSMTAAALRAMAEDLIERGAGGGFEIVVLSDSTNVDAWIRESLVFRRLRDELAGRMPVWYRRRWRNVARKAGNVADFIRNWGSHYDFFLVLDADSVLSAETIVALAGGIAADDRLGLLQSVPMLTGGDTLFARLQQFAGAVYGPIVGRGLAAWSGNDGNFWGHNAIIRTRAFAEAAGLPDLPGRKPIGGPIMSHDFVEAALLRRAGWRVRMAPDLGGSYEASPPSLIDVAKRDRRWAQGNIQHLGVIGARGLRWPNRVHLATGIFSYLSSALWLTLILIGLVLAGQAQFIRPEYFAEEYQLFPDWPRFDAERMLYVLALTAVVLFMPKIVGYLRGLFHAPTRRASGGAIALTFSVILEIVLSALYAPIMMVIQTHQLYDIARGRDSGWVTQRRSTEGDAWREVWSLHQWHMLAGVLLALPLVFINIYLLGWLSPVILGLLLAVPLSWASGRAGIGNALRRMRLLLVESETVPPPILTRRDEIAAAMTELPSDGIAYLAAHPDDAIAHVAFNLPRPPVLPGHPDADLLTAEAKLTDAANREEALGWLTAPERMRIAADARLLEKLAGLAHVERQGWASRADTDA